MHLRKTMESLGYLDELKKIYTDPLAHFQKRVEKLKSEKNARQAPISFTFCDSFMHYRHLASQELLRYICMKKDTP